MQDMGSSLVLGKPQDAKGERMKEENTGFTDQQKAELDALAALPEDEILRDDIPLRYWTDPVQKGGVSTAL